MIAAGRVVLSPMQEDDLDEVMALEQASFPEPWTRKMFLGELRGNAFAVNVIARARDAGTVLGYILFWVVFEELHLMNLAVRPEARRRGLGTDLVRHALSVGATGGVRTALLEVRASNVAAIALYEGLGFARTCVRKGYYDRPREDAVMMTRVIEKGGATMLNEDPTILASARRESSEFKTLEDIHHRLEAQLSALNKRHFLTPTEEQDKKKIQRDKLATKDKMAAIVRHVKQNGATAAGLSS